MKAAHSPCFSVLVYCHSHSPTETILQTSPTCLARSNWAHHTAVWPCSPPLPNPSFPLDLLFNFAFWSCLILQLLSCAGMAAGILLERHKFFEHSVPQPQHSSRKTDRLEQFKDGLGVSPCYKTREWDGILLTWKKLVKSATSKPHPVCVPFKASQISSGGNLTLLMSGTVTACIILCLPNTGITQEFV